MTPEPTNPTPNPELWHIVERDSPDQNLVIRSADEDTICEIWIDDCCPSGDDFNWKQIAKAEKIVASVNACAGINPAAVPDLIKLAELAKKLLDYTTITPRDILHLRDMAVSALAKANQTTPA